MSFQAMTWAVEQKLPAQQKIVLLMLANRTNHDTGRCDPSHKRLADDCGMSIDSVKRAIRLLEGSGHLVTIARSMDGVRLPNQYMLNLRGVGADSTGGWVHTAPGVGADSTIKQEFKQEDKTIDASHLANSGEFSLTSDEEQPKSKSGLTEMVDAYHRLLPDCQSIHVLGDKRKKKMILAQKMAMRTCKDQGWNWDAAWFWDAYFTECSHDPWRAGKVPNLNNPGWKQNIEVLIDEKRFTEVMDQTIAVMQRGEE